MYKNVILALTISLLFSCKQNAKPSLENNLTLLQTEKPIVKTKNAEIVFCLDATGSMSGLIGTAKEKIWDIVSEFAQDNTIDSLKLGMVFYRDRGDAFVTKFIPLTTDLDDVYSQLLEMNAAGGGDQPESVNQALNESINDIKWSTSPNTYKTIFVVGDCPPHMDYQDEMLYTESCKIAASKNIIINTIKLGNSCLEAITHFKKMSECSNGNFLQLDQNATDYVIATPYDEEINTISKEIDKSRLYYGSATEQAYNYDKKTKSLEVYDDASITANSARATFKNSKSGRKTALGTKEIINDYLNGDVALETIKEEELPAEFKNKTTKEKTQLIEQLSIKRTEQSKNLKALTIKRLEYIKKNTKEDSTSFSKEVVKVMQKQSKTIK